LNNKTVVNAQETIVIEVDLLFVIARTAILNWEIPIGVPELGVFGGISTPWSCGSIFSGA
jgi:hypothetical protein